MCSENAVSNVGIPTLVEVAELVSSRYNSKESGAAQARPESWDQRAAGIDVVRTVDGQELRLASDGMQSPPKKNWIILLTAGNESDGYAWTLYGLPKS